RTNAPQASSNTPLTHQTAITITVEATALIEMPTTVSAHARLSRINGKATTEIASAATANRNPRRTPYTISPAPRRVVTNWVTKSDAETGGSSPNTPK